MEPINTTNVTYIGVFLTLSCNYKCPYCINRHGALTSRKHLTGEAWIRGLSRIQTRVDLPITLQGGEPTIHKDFYQIVNILAVKGKYMDLLTNFSMPMSRWTLNTFPSFFCRPSKYPSIRVSYHPGQSPILGLFWRVYRATRQGMSIGIWAVDCPDTKLSTWILRKLAKLLRIEFRLKEFLGWYGGAFYGEYRYPKAVSQATTKTVECKSAELLIGPDGNIYKCHADLYADRNPIGNIMDDIQPEVGKWRSCDQFGACNPCDIKEKTNRFQQGGFCAVEIRDTLAPLNKQGVT